MYSGAATRRKAFGLVVAKKVEKSTLGVLMGSIPPSPKVPPKQRTLTINLKTMAKIIYNLVNFGVLLISIKNEPDELVLTI